MLYPRSFLCCVVTLYDGGAMLRCADNGVLVKLQCVNGVCCGIILLQSYSAGVVSSVNGWCLMLLPYCLKSVLLVY